MDTNSSGTIVKWFDDKGYGFIEPEAGGAQLFFHVRSIKNSGRRDLLGQRVNYERYIGNDGRPSADPVYLVTAEARTPRPVRPQRRGGSASAALPAALFSGAFLIAIFLLSRAGHLPQVLPFIYAGTSVVTLFVYLSDKRRASARQWRTSENFLHGLEMIGGWPGALVAQRLFRHKTSKGSYQVTFWFIVLLHLGGLGYYLLSTARPSVAVEFSPGGPRPAAPQRTPYSSLTNSPGHPTQA